MDAEFVTDEVTDRIAYIEMNRQLTVQEAGLAISCREAIRELLTLLDCETAALPKDCHADRSANVEALKREIAKVRTHALSNRPVTPMSRHLSI